MKQIQIKFILVNKTLRIAAFENNSEVARTTIAESLDYLLRDMLNKDRESGDVRWLRACRNVSRNIRSRTNEIAKKRMIRDSEIQRARI